MLLFSKRNKSIIERRLPSSADRDDERRKLYERMHYRRLNPLDTQLRTRLRKQVVLVVETGNYLEPFLLTKDISTNSFYLNEPNLRKLCLIELGHDLTNIINCETLLFNNDEYTDFLFFDLIELLIIFTKENEREGFVSRLQEIFDEENDSYIIHDFMITKKGSGLKSVIPILQDKTLQTLVKDYEDSLNHIDAARISAGIIQRIFSGDGKLNTKEFSEGICEEVAKRWTDTDNTESLKRLLNDTVTNAKSLVNQINNIRHTDKFSIPIEGPSMYRMIAQNNMAIAELVILSLPERFVIKQKATDLKKGYLEKYSIDKNFLTEVDSSIVNIDDIPF